MRRLSNLHNRLRALEKQRPDTQEPDEYFKMAFESLSPDQQGMVLRSIAILQKYEEKAEKWENQPDFIKAREPFYEEYIALSEICRHGFLTNHWMTEEENKLVTEASDLLFAAEKKFNPYYKKRGLH